VRSDEIGTALVSLSRLANVRVTAAPAASFSR
jgi:hypothetical protein